MASRGEIVNMAITDAETYTKVTFNAIGGGEVVGIRSRGGKDIYLAFEASPSAYITIPAGTMLELGTDKPIYLRSAAASDTAEVMGVV